MALTWFSTNVSYFLMISCSPCSQVFFFLGISFLTWKTNSCLSSLAFSSSTSTGEGDYPSRYHIRMESTKSTSRSTPIVFRPERSPPVSSRAPWSTTPQNQTSVDLNSSPYFSRSVQANATSKPMSSKHEAACWYSLPRVSISTLATGLDLILLYKIHRSVRRSSCTQIFQQLRAGQIVCTSLENHIPRSTSSFQRTWRWLSFHLPKTSFRDQSSRDILSCWQNIHSNPFTQNSLRLSLLLAPLLWLLSRLGTVLVPFVFDASVYYLLSLRSSIKLKSLDYLDDLLNWIESTGTFMTLPVSLHLSSESVSEFFHTPLLDNPVFRRLVYILDEPDDFTLRSWCWRLSMANWDGTLGRSLIACVTST